MTNKNIYRSLGGLDPELIAKAAPVEKVQKKNTWVKWASMAACLAVLLGGITMLPSLLEDGVTPEITNGRYKANVIQTEALGAVFPWEYLTTAEKYVYLDVAGKAFNARQREVSEEYIGNKIGAFKAMGFDNTVDECVYTEIFDVYEIKGISSDELVAARIEDKYFVFISDEYNPPSTFGQFMEIYNLSEYIEFNRFSFKGDGVEENYYFINDDENVWNILKSCANAPFYADEIAWHKTKGNYISFTVTSEAFGVYKNALYVTENGYVWTNLFNGAFIYNIGTEAAASIINYVKENSTKTVYEPFYNAIYGEVVEIKDDYILVDDSILCKNPAEGIVFKIMLNDLRISRYFDCNMINVGETVQISFEGDMKNNTVDSAINVDRIIVSDEQILIPE